MQLNVTEREAELLRALLQDYLTDFRREIARTEHHGYRHELVERENLIERLVKQLAAGAGAPTS